MKTVTVKQGEYAGKTAEIIGTDFDVFGKSIFGVKGEEGFDYMKRLAMNGYSTLDKVFIAKIEGHDHAVALNENELKAKKEKENV
jgi:hypothetical protein